MDQNASAVLMVRPAKFGFNPETADTNAFQNTPGDKTAEEIQELALAEFDRMAGMLQAQGVQVIVMHDTPMPVKPDAIFPNNWFSTSHNGELFLYPMCAPNRRLERRRGGLVELLGGSGFQTTEGTDISHYEQDGLFLEGTGSLVFDHRCRVVYACLSPRTSPQILADMFVNDGQPMMPYELVAFAATDAEGKAIYHTNVVMSIGDKFAVVCFEAMNVTDKARVRQQLEQSGRHIVSITREQMNHFCGNILQLQTNQSSKIVVMSDTAHKSFDLSQLALISGQDSGIIVCNIPTIEKYGGGSARCMMAEIFLPYAG